MAPEQAVADPIDHRIDLFALGIIIYEMLSGKLPFDGTGAEVARANLLLDPPPISQRVPYLEVDPLLEAFARRLMAKKRDHRPATAKAARELLDLIEKDPAAAAVALAFNRRRASPRSPCRRHRRPGTRETRTTRFHRRSAPPPAPTRLIVAPDRHRAGRPRRRARTEASCRTVRRDRHRARRCDRGGDCHDARHGRCARAPRRAEGRDCGPTQVRFATAAAPARGSCPTRQSRSW